MQKAASLSAQASGARKAVALRGGRQLQAGGGRNPKTQRPAPRSPRFAHAGPGLAPSRHGSPGSAPLVGPRPLRPAAATPDVSEARARRAGGRTGRGGAGPGAAPPPPPPPAAASARASQPLFHSLCSAPLSWSTPAGGAALKVSRPFREREPILLAAAALAGGGGGGGSELGGSQSRATLLVIRAEWAVVEWNRKAAKTQWSAAV